MNIIKVFGIGVFFLLYINTGWAACYVNHSSAERQDMLVNFGRLLVTPEIPVGSILASQSYGIQEIRNAWRCDFLIGGLIRADFNQNGAVDGDILSTNIPGIGLRLQLTIGNEAPRSVPFSFYQQGFFRQVHDLPAGELQVDVIKTAQQTGTGRLNPGTYASLYAEGSFNSPTVTAMFNPQSLVVVSAACTVDVGSQNKSVLLPKVGTSAFKGVGSTAGAQRFNLALNCSGGSGDGNGQDALIRGNISLRFSYNTYSNAQTSLIRIENNVNSARGIALQLLEEKNFSAIENDESVYVGHTTVNAFNVLTLPLIIQYYQAEEQIRAGDVRATAIFTIEYD